MELKLLKQDLETDWVIKSHGSYGFKMDPVISEFQIIELLDSVVGARNWQNKIHEGYHSVGIRLWSGWIWKEGETFKSACLKWGIGLFLSEIDSVTIPTLTSIDEQGQPKIIPIHNPEKYGDCPDDLLKEIDGKPSLFIRDDKLSEYAKWIQ